MYPLNKSEKVYCKIEINILHYIVLLAIIIHHNIGHKTTIKTNKKLFETLAKFYAHSK